MRTAARYPSVLVNVSACALLAGLMVVGSLTGVAAEDGSCPFVEGQDTEAVSVTHRALQQTSSNCVVQPYWLALTPTVIPVGSVKTVTGSSVGGCTTNPSFLIGIKHHDACRASTGGAGHAWIIRPHTKDRQITLSTCGLTTEDTVITVRQGCATDSPVVACQNNDGTDACISQSTLSFRAVAGVEYSVFVQAADPRACYSPSMSVDVKDYVPVPSVLDACPVAPTWVKDPVPLTINTLRQAFTTRVGTSCPNLSGPQGVEHTAACIDTPVAASPAAVWSYISQESQQVTVTACVPASLSLIPVLTVQSGCAGNAELVACTGSVVTDARCGKFATVTFNVQAGEVFTVFAQTLATKGSTATCWTQPAIDVSTQALDLTIHSPPAPSPPAPGSFVVTEAAPPTTSSGMRFRGPYIVAAALGGAALLVMVLLGVWLMCRGRCTKVAAAPVKGGLKEALVVHVGLETLEGMMHLPGRSPGCSYNSSARTTMDGKSELSDEDMVTEIKLSVGNMTCKPARCSASGSESDMEEGGSGDHEPPLPPGFMP